MLKTKRSDFVLVVIVMFSMLTMYAYMPMAQADSLNYANTTLSDSEGGETATSTILFRPDIGLNVDEYMRVTYASSEFQDFVVIAASACPADTTASSSETSNDFRVVECVATAYIVATGSPNYQIEIQHRNPTTEDISYSVTVSTHEADGTEIESTETKVYILSDVSVTATVPATLTFGVELLGMNSTRNTINGVALTGTSSATALAFGTLDPAASSTYGHELTVETNASGGYTVTVQQDAELTNGAANTINSFDNANDGFGNASTTAVWSGPDATLGTDRTYGHMGVIGDDISDMSVDYSGSQYAGLDAANPLQVMAHDGPANGAGEGTGIAGVAYTIEISALQEAGDYESNLTYVCTPTY